MYVDMVKAGTVDNTVLTTSDDRVGLNAFSAGAAPFYATGPNLARHGQGHQRHPVRQPRHGPAAARQVRRGGQGPDVDLGQEGHQVPERVHRARAVLHQPAEHGRVRQAGRDLPVVRRRRTTIRSSRRPRPPSRTAPGRIAKDIIATYAGHRPDRPEQGRRQRHRPARRSSRRCSTTSPAQAGARQAVADANKLLEVAHRARDPVPRVRIRPLARPVPGAGQPLVLAAGRATGRGIMTGHDHDQEALAHAVHVPAAGAGRCWASSSSTRSSRSSTTASPTTTS